MKTMLFCLSLLVSLPLLAQPAGKGVFGLPAQPNTFSYDYVEVGLLHMDRHNLNGLRSSGSFTVMHNLSVIGSLTAAMRSDAEQQALTAGVAYHQKLHGTVLQATDFILHAELEAQRIKLERRFLRDRTETHAGVVVGAGLRNRLIDDVEVFADFSVRTTGSTDPFVTLGGRFSVLPELQLQASLEVGDNDTFLTGVRYSF
ncbi:MAG TPA: hypothetical protein VIN71_04925 [Pseudomonadales bacterium]